MRMLISIIVLVLLAITPAFGGTIAGTEETPFGVTTQPDAKGQKLAGVMSIEFSMLDTRFASQARVLLRLRKGSQLGSVFATVPGVLDTDDAAAVQQAVFAVIRPRVLGKFFPIECGTGGNLCPSVDLVLKNVEEVSSTDDGVSALFLIGDVVLAATAPTK